MPTLGAAPPWAAGLELVATVAYKRPRALAATATSICDKPSGSPSLSCLQWSPPSLDLYNPPFGPLYMFLSSHGPERASQKPAYRVLASLGSILTNELPVFSPRFNTFTQVAPPSDDRYRPRCTLGP